MNKFEDCVLAVKAKQPKGCVKNRLWGQKINDKTCYNPWAVCRSMMKKSKRSPFIKVKGYTRKSNGRKIKVRGYRRSRSRS